MAVYVVTGKLGGGKSLISVSKIREKLLQGCPVATNLDLKLHKLLPADHRNARVIRIPDQPSADDLRALGSGNTTYDEEKNGLLVLDECGTWFNARNWNDKARKGVNDWFLHARKLGWDVLLIVQDVEILDSQARRAIAEHTVFCKRLDRLHIPFFGSIYKLLVGEPLRLPRVHIGKVIYGTSETGPMSDRWVYRGSQLFSAYDTKQAFLDDYPHGVHSLLPPWHYYGRYLKPRDWTYIMRMTKIYWKRFKAPFALAAGIAVGAIAASAAVAAIHGKTPETALPVLSVAEPDPVPVNQPIMASEPSELLKRVEQLQIVGYAEMGKRRHYHFAIRDNVAPGVTPVAATSVDLVRMGLKMRSLNECYVEFVHGGHTVPVYCR